MPKQLQNKVLNAKIVSVIKVLRKQNKVTLEDFYFDTGIHLARIEQGNQNITIATLAVICSYLDLTLRDFFEKVEEL